MEIPKDALPNSFTPTRKLCQEEKFNLETVEEHTTQHLTSLNLFSITEISMDGSILSSKNDNLFKMIFDSNVIQ